MPEPLQPSEVESQTDPSISKQKDEETPKEIQFQELYKTVDSLKFCLLTTIRPHLGPVSRSMGVAKRNGPDFLFLANFQSSKFKDLEHNKQAQITFQNSSSQEWVSITGEVTTASNSDPRIKTLYSTSVSAWFGDLGDGKHNGTADDPRLALIEVKPRYISHWKPTVGALGFVKEVGVAALTGQVAKTGVQREFFSEDIEAARYSG